jgi:hypothetical protein
MEKVPTTYRLPQDLRHEVAAFAATRGLPVATAVSQLLRAGLAAENSGLYAQPVATMVRDIMRGELALFRECQEGLIDEDARLIAEAHQPISAANQAMLMLLVQVFSRVDDTVEVNRLFELYQLAGAYAACGHSHSEALRLARVELDKARLSAEQETASELL